MVFAERREAEGLAAERKEIEEHLSRESYRRWVAAAAMGAVSDGELREGFMKHYGDGKGATGKDDTVGYIQPHDLCVFLIANQRAFELLRLPENRDVALTVRKYLPWVYVLDDY